MRIDRTACIGSGTYRVHFDDDEAVTIYHGGTGSPLAYMDDDELSEPSAARLALALAAVGIAPAA